jgi:hypothetical protein
MNVWQTSTKRVALVLLAAAVVAPAALGNSGQPVAGNSHLADLTAMAKSYRAQAGTSAPTTAYNSHLAELTAMANSHVHVTNSHLAELTAMANAYQAQTGKIAYNSHLADLTAMDNSFQAASAARATSGNFDWGDAGIGATSGFAAAIALAATLLFVLRRRPRRPGAGTPTTA